MISNKNYSELFEIPTVEHLTYPWGKRVSVVEPLTREEYEQNGINTIGFIMNKYMENPEIWSAIEKTGLPSKYFTGQIAGCRYTLECVLICLSMMNIFDVIAIDGLKKTRATVVVCFKQKVDNVFYKNLCILLSYCIEDYFDIRDIKIYIFNGTKEEVLKGIKNHASQKKIEKILKSSEKMVKKSKNDVILWCNDKGVSYK